MSTSNNPANPPPPTNPNPPINPAPAAQQHHVSKFREDLSKFIEILKKASKKLIIWLFFTVIIGLLPIIASGLLGHFNHTLKDNFDLFFHGELLIISFVLAADAMGDLINSN